MIRRWVSSHFLIIVLIVTFIIFVSLPIILDILYGAGVLGRIYENNFSADIWFSFLGSYLPGTLFGALTIYLTLEIRRKDNQYNDLLNQYLFVPYRNAEVFRFSPENLCIGKWNCYDFSQSLERREDNDEESNLEKEWDKGYVIKYSIHNVGRIGIDSIECNSIEWNIGSDPALFMKDKHRIKTVCHSIGESRYEVYSFWTFSDDDGSVAQKIATLMNNKARKNPNYFSSYLRMKAEITNQEKKKYKISMSFKLQCPDEKNPYKLQSVEEHFFPGEI